MERDRQPAGFESALQEYGRLEDNQDLTEPIPKMLSKNLSVYYGEFQALNDISLEIPRNKITALIGPSGCGKSTFLRSLNRMLELIPGTTVTGEVLLDGENIYEKDKDPVLIRGKVGMVFQSPNPFPKSIFNNVAYGPRLYGIKREDLLMQIVQESLEKAALWGEVKDKLKKSAFALSGGQQQRLCIARALAVEPEVILMDEPASALDPIATSKIENLMRELSQNYTIVVVTHNMQQAARVSDYTAFFMTDDSRTGKIMEVGPTEEFFTNPQNPQTEAYITGRFG